MYKYLDSYIEKLKEQCLSTNFQDQCQGQANEAFALCKCLLDFRDTYFSSKMMSEEDIHFSPKIHELLKILRKAIERQKQQSDSGTPSQNIVFVNRRYLAKLVTDLINIIGKYKLEKFKIIKLL